MTGEDKEKAIRCAKLLWEKYNDVNLVKECAFFDDGEEIERTISFIENTKTLPAKKYSVKSKNKRYFEVESI